MGPARIWTGARRIGPPPVKPPKGQRVTLADALRSMTTDERVRFHDMANRVARGEQMVETPREIETPAAVEAIERHGRERGFAPFAPAR